MKKAWSRFYKVSEVSLAQNNATSPVGWTIPSCKFSTCSVGLGLYAPKITKINWEYTKLLQWKGAQFFGPFGIISWIEAKYNTIVVYCTQSTERLWRDIHEESRTVIMGDVFIKYVNMAQEMLQDYKSGRTMHLPFFSRFLSFSPLPPIFLAPRQQPSPKSS